MTIDLADRGVTVIAAGRGLGGSVITLWTICSALADKGASECRDWEALIFVTSTDVVAWGGRCGSVSVTFADDTGLEVESRLRPLALHPISCVVLN